MDDEHYLSRFRLRDRLPVVIREALDEHLPTNQQTRIEHEQTSEDR